MSSQEGWITVTAQTLYRKPEFGFAVRFVEMSAGAAGRLRRAIVRLKLRALFDA